MEIRCNVYLRDSVYVGREKINDLIGRTQKYGGQ